jgi:hypothetical protein
MTDQELILYYEKYKNYQAGVIEMSLNLRDLMRLFYLVKNDILEII